jgi:NADH-quinone oxidoreductase subunit J
MLEQLIFYIFIVLFVGNALMVVLSRNAVYSALFLVLTFFAAAALWMFLEAEFLALILLLVYVGAVMTLFLFVVMMLNLDKAHLKKKFVKYSPFAFVLIVFLVAAMVYILGPLHFHLTHTSAPARMPAHYSNIKQLGEVLYTHYVYPFELAAVLLLIAIVAAISLTLRQPRTKKRQNIRQQLQADPKERLTLHAMKAEPQTATQLSNKEESDQ